MEDIDGCIHSIHVRNFFCHENLEINLNRNVNFVFGRNGSGKSAILTALVVGLGGRASATNRGSNLHSFIKKGANSATVEIKIKNNSPKAFKHNIYGDYITVVRNINASGGSSYKLKSASGEVISTKFEDVNSLIIAHNIQVDNPISILNQDDAISFHASDAKKKYSLFRKATKLDQTESNYMEALENCKKITSNWSRKNEACQELEKEYKKWKSNYDQLQSRDEIELQKQALQNEYYWSEIADYEREAETLQAQYDKQKTRVDRFLEKLNQMKDHYGNNSEALEALKAELDEKTLQKTALEQELRELEGDVREVQVAHRATQQAAAKHAELLNREKRKVTDIEREINNVDSGRSASRRAELEERAKLANEEARAAAARYDTAHRDAQQARGHLEHAHAQHEAAAALAQRARAANVQLKQQLRELESRGHDSLAVYGNSMVELCQRVKQAAARREFSAPPKGPIGSYLKVKDKKWGGVIEHIMGGSLNSFCVNSPEDSRKLFEIMGQVYGKAGKPSVTSSKFLSQRHDVSEHKVRAPGFASALDSLDVADPVVANYLIDNVGIEKVLLVPSHEDAVRLSDTVENVPVNCARVVTLDCSEFYPAPNYRCYGGRAKPTRYLQVSTAERKRQVQAEIQESDSKLRDLEATAERLNRELNEARQNERACSRSLQAHVGERHAKDEAVRAATAALQQLQAPHHAVLLEELNISKDKLRSLEEQNQSHAELAQQQRRKIDELDARMRIAKNKLADVSATIRTLSEEIEQEEMKMSQGASDRIALQNKLQAEEAKLAAATRVLGDKRAHVDKLTAEAQKLCERMPRPRDLAIVTHELKKTQLKLNSNRSDGLSKAEVAEKLLEVERKYRRTKQTLDRLKSLVDEIKSTTDIHLNICHRLQNYVARSVQLSFQSILAVRGYSGSMKIDNSRSSLDIMCTGREKAAQRHASTSSSLSGGERSYATVAFIMALWECVELPFYFMDEYDVFMDVVTRKIVTELLIDHAMQNKNRQFVFLTPKDVSTDETNPLISKHLMADPRP